MNSCELRLRGRLLAGESPFLRGDCSGGKARASLTGSLDKGVLCHRLSVWEAV